MRYATTVGLLLAWALWLGGLCMMLTSAPMLFARDPQIAPRAASLLFVHFEKLQMIAAACAVVLAAIVTIRYGGMARRLLLVGILLAALLATTSSQVITPQIERMRQEGQTQTPVFRRTHGISMMLLLGELIVLAGSGFALPSALARDSRH